MTWNFVNGSPEAKRTSDTQVCLITPPFWRQPSMKSSLKTKLSRAIGAAFCGDKRSFFRLLKCCYFRSRDDVSWRSIDETILPCPEQDAKRCHWYMQHALVCMHSLWPVRFEFFAYVRCKELTKVDEFDYLSCRSNKSLNLRHFNWGFSTGNGFRREL